LRKRVSFSAPFNGDIDLIDLMPEAVAEIYGKLSHDGFLGGRAICSLLEVKKDTFAHAISICKRRSIRFNYILNAPYQGDDQFTKAFYNTSADLLAFLVDIGVWGITVSLPHIVSFSKRHFPELSVTISKYARVNTIPRLKVWESIGVDRICIDGNLTKRPHLIQAMTAASNIPLIMLCNDASIEDCPFENSHAIYEGSHSIDRDSIYYTYFSTLCKYIRATDKPLLPRKC
jgi:collagenase-like PrtC family protease